MIQAQSIIRISTYIRVQSTSTTLKDIDSPYFANKLLLLFSGPLKPRIEPVPILIPGSIVLLAPVLGYGWVSEDMIVR